MSAADDRARVVAEARTWLGTPWRHQARVKGAGVDCGQLVDAVFAACGLIQPTQIIPYPRDFMLHTNEQRFLTYVEQHCQQVEGPALPADLALWQFGRVICHGGIVLAWPEVIHAYYVEGKVVVSRTDQDTRLSDPKHFKGFWRLKGWL